MSFGGNSVLCECVLLDDLHVCRARLHMLGGWEASASHTPKEYASVVRLAALPDSLSEVSTNLDTSGRRRIERPWLARSTASLGDEVRPL